MRNRDSVLLALRFVNRVLALGKQPFQPAIAEAVWNDNTIFIQVCRPRLKST